MTDKPKTLTDYVDALLPRLAVLSLIALCIVQAVLFMEGTRQYISRTDRIEGEQLVSGLDLPKRDLTQTVLEPLKKLRNSEPITISVLSAEKSPNIVLLVNGKSVGNLKNGPIRLTVYENDYLEIDASRWPHPARIQLSAEKDIVLPMNGVVIETYGDTAAIGKVKLK